MSKLRMAPTLTSIPPEIRLCIYQYILRTSVFQIDAPALKSDSSKLTLSHCTPAVSTTLFRVCKLIHQEAQPVLFLDNTFQFLHPLSGLCSSPLSAFSLGCLRTVIIGPFQSTAKKAKVDMAATRLFVRSGCPRLETLSCRHWLVKHMDANIDENQDFAPILETRYYFDIENSTPRKQPLKYTMGILRSTEHEEKPVNDGMASVDIYSALYLDSTGKDERASLFETWAKISTKSLLNLVGKGGEGDTVCERSMKLLSGQIVVDRVIEMDWRAIANDLGHQTLLL